MKAVTSEIDAAFDGVPAPPEERILHFPGVGNDLWIESFLGQSFRNWSDIPGDSIARENAALTVVSPDAFVFFLPAYMKWVLENFESSDSCTVDNTLYNLNLTGRDRSTRQIMLARFEKLTLKQRQATLSFLKYMSDPERSGVDTTAAQQAIDSYWGEYGREI